MKSRLKPNKDVVKTIETIEKQMKRLEQRTQLFSILSMCIALNRKGICDNTIKTVVANSEKITTELLNEMLSNKVSFKNSKKEHIDCDYNRDKLHEMCLQWDFDFDDEIFVRKEFTIGKEKFIL